MDAKKLSIKTIRQLLALADKFCLDTLEVPGLKITKSKHQLKDSTQKGAIPPVSGSYEPTSIDEIDAEIKKTLGVG